jgi:insulysin
MLSSISEEIFKDIYLDYQKIKLIKSLFNTNNNPVEIAIDIIENMISLNYDELNLCILKKDYVPEYNSTIYQKFKKYFDKIKIKIITNINLKNISENEFNVSKWYSTKYYSSSYDVEVNNDSLNIKNYDYDVTKIIGIKNMIIKTNIEFRDIKKETLPEIILKNNEKEVYYVEYNKYGKPISSVNVIRKNLYLLDKHNRIIMLIYTMICNKILNYYLEIMYNYTLKFNVSIHNEFIVYSYEGIHYLLNNFIANIIKLISNENIIQNENFNKYFEKTKIEIIDSYKNLKYNSPYTLCIQYLSFKLTNNLLPKEIIEYINSLSIDNFLTKLADCLKYQHEYFLIAGIERPQINDIVDMLTINYKQYYDPNISIITDYKNYNYNYKLKMNEYNKKEINNCLVQCYIMKNSTIKLVNGKISKNKINNLLKKQLIYSLIAELINEPLFDKIRTIDKLGYIVKCIFKSNILHNRVIMIISYLVQSKYNIKKIENSVNNFNKEFYKNFNENLEQYEEKFKILKKSKLLEYEKSFSDFIDEISSYVEAFLNKTGIFNINKLLCNIINTIEFSDISRTIKKMLTKNKKFKIILKSSISPKFLISKNL